MIMIIGYSTSMKLKKFSKFDYFGCFYPIGIVDLKKVIVFRHEDIEKIFFFLYNSKELKKLNILNNFIEGEKNE